MTNHTRDKSPEKGGRPSPEAAASRADEAGGKRTGERAQKEQAAQRRRREKAAAKAEAREKAAWIAERKRQEQEAAEAEAREKAAWIAERKRQEREAAEAEAREKAAWIAKRKRQEQEIHRAEHRAELAARHREQAAREEAARRRAEKRAAKRRKRLRSLKIALLVLMLTTILLGCGWLVISHKLAKSETPSPTMTEKTAADTARQTPEQSPESTPEEKLQELPPEERWEDLSERKLRVELPMGVSFEMDRQEAGLTRSRWEAVNKAKSDGEGSSDPSGAKNELSSELDRTYLRQRAAAAVAQFREKTSGPDGQSWFLDEEAKVLHVIKGAGELDIDLDKLCAAAEEALLGKETTLEYSQIKENVTQPDWLKLKRLVSVRPVEPRLSDTDFEVLPGVPGLSFDVQKAIVLWETAEIMEEVLIPMRVVPPKTSPEQLLNSLFSDCLGEQTTSYGGSSAARVNNINLAVSKIDGVILMPGETFSYNGTVGERTYENGFKEAGAYSNGEVVQEVGGGICQVSSTLYCASLYSRMTIVSRTYHYFRVAYLDPGMDATVSWPEPDFKFRNDRDYPVKIHAFCDNDAMKLTVQILGTDTDGIRVKLSYDQYIIHDTEYPDVIIGSNVYLKISYYDADGNWLETRDGLASTYHLHDYEINWPPEKFKDDEENGGGDGDGTVIIDPGSGDTGGGDTGGGDTGGGDTGGGDTGGGDTGGGDTGGGDTGGGDTGGDGEIIVGEP